MQLSIYGNQNFSSNAVFYYFNSHDHLHIFENWSNLIISPKNFPIQDFIIWPIFSMVRFTYIMLNPISASFPFSNDVTVVFSDCENQVKDRHTTGARVNGFIFGLLVCTPHPLLILLSYKHYPLAHPSSKSYILSFLPFNYLCN